MKSRGNKGREVGEIRVEEVEGNFGRGSRGSERRGNRVVRVRRGGGLRK